MSQRTRDVLTHLAILLIVGCVGVSAVARAAGPPPKATAADEQTYREFEQIVADLPTPDKIQAWEAYLLKYPTSAYVPKVKDTIAVLKGDKRPAPAATPMAQPTKVTSDRDLDFLNDGSSSVASSTPAPTPSVIFVATPTPTPMVAATPRPVPTATPRRVAAGGSNSDSFMDAPPERAPHRDQTRVAWNDPSSSDRPPIYTGPRGPREPRGIGAGRASHTEVAAFGGIAPDETYVRNTLFGVAATQRFGHLWALELEGAAAQNSETSLLRSLRALDAEPEVISKFNFLAGGAIEANLLSAIDGAGRIPGRNDLYVIAGGGVVNTDLEICKQEGTTKCATPLFINGVNFGYATGGVGHRFYIARWMTIRSEVRGRVIFELIDGTMTPRANIQIDVGPSVVF